VEVSQCCRGMVLSRSSCVWRRQHLPKGSRVVRPPSPLVCEKADGYHGIWYAEGEWPGDVKYRFSGGLAAFSPHQVPMALYAAKAERHSLSTGYAPRRP